MTQSTNQQTLAKLVEEAMAVQQIISGLEERIKYYTAELRRITEQEIPGLMAEEELTAFATEDYKVSVKEILTASLAQKNKTPALNWLEQHGYDDIIERRLDADLSNVSEEKFERIAATLHSQGVTSVYFNRDVNTIRIKSLIKELLEAGEDVPLDIFGAHRVTKAVIKPTKEK